MILIHSITGSFKVLFKPYLGQVTYHTVAHSSSNLINFRVNDDLDSRETD